VWTAKSFLDDEQSSFALFDQDDAWPQQVQSQTWRSWLPPDDPSGEPLANFYLAHDESWVGMVQSRPWAAVQFLDEHPVPPSINFDFEDAWPQLVQQVIWRSVPFLYDECNSFVSLITGPYFVDVAQSSAAGAVKFQPWRAGQEASGTNEAGSVKSKARPG
jgi:hypothetical protein